MPPPFTLARAGVLRPHWQLTPSAPHIGLSSSVGQLVRILASGKHPLRLLVAIRRRRGEAPFGTFKQLGGLRRFAGRGLDYATRKTLIAAVG